MKSTRWKAICALLAAASLCACTTLSRTTNTYPNNAAMIYRAAHRAGEQLLSKNPGLAGKYYIALHNLDSAAAAQSPSGNIVRDALTESISKNSKVLFERDPSAIIALAKESGKLTAVSGSGYAQGPGAEKHLDAATIRSSAELNSANVILAYRITDAGITYSEGTAMGTLKRTAYVELFYEFVAASTTQVLSAGRIAGIAEDEIPSSQRPELENPVKGQWPYPFEKAGARHAVPLYNPETPNMLAKRPETVSKPKASKTMLHGYEVFGGLGMKLAATQSAASRPTQFNIGPQINIGARQYFGDWAIAGKLRAFKYELTDALRWNPSLGRFTRPDPVSTTALELKASAEYNLWQRAKMRGYLFAGPGLMKVDTWFPTYNAGAGFSYLITEKWGTFIEADYTGGTNDMLKDLSSVCIGATYRV